MAQVVRLEAANGEGIFHSGVCRRAWNEVADARGCDAWDLDEHEPNPARHPAPCEDVPEWDEHPLADEFYCAFRDLDHLVRWFDSEAHRVAMNSLGARMVTYEVAPEDILQGTAQIMIRMCRATRLGDAPVPTIA